MKHALLLALVLVGCSKEPDDSEPISLPLATYAVSRPLCASSNASPDYPSVAKKLSLYDFDELASIMWKIGGSSVEQSFKTAECEMTVKRPIFRNSLELFSFRNGRTNSWTPTKCRLNASVGGETASADPESFAPLKDSKDANEDVMFEVEHDKESGTYRLISADFEALKTVWAGFGCAASDRLYYTLTAQ